MKNLEPYTPSASGSYGKPAVRQNTGRFGNSLQIALVGFSRCLTKVQLFIVLPMHFGQFFQVKYIVRRVMEECKSGMPCFFMSIFTIKYYHT